LAGFRLFFHLVEVMLDTLIKKSTKSCFLRHHHQGTKSEPVGNIGDDLRALGVRRKLAGQVLIASAAYWLGWGIHFYKIPWSERMLGLGIYAWPVTIFWLVALTNLINLINGLAGGIDRLPGQPGCFIELHPPI
jgi:hypothetical protein